MIKKSLYLLVSALVLAVAASVPAQTIDNLSNWNGSSGFGTFGNRTSSQGAASTYGQTFVAPPQSILRSWETAFKNAATDGGTFNYRFYIAPWDDAASRLASAPIFSSGELTSPVAGAGYVALNVAVGLMLTPGVKYVAFTSTLDEAVRPAGAAFQAGYSDSDTYLNGGFVQFDNNVPVGLSALGTYGWDTQFASYYDTAFRAEFQAVPEPATMIALGLGGLEVIRRRKRL